MISNTKDNTISVIELTMRCNNLFHQALLSIKNHDDLMAQECFNYGNELLLKASIIHANPLKEEDDINLLLVHAEDLLISVQLYKSMMKEFVEIYKNFPTLKGNQKSLINK